MSRRESITSPTITTRSKSHVRKKPGRKANPKLKKSPQTRRTSRSPRGRKRILKTYRSAKTLDPNAETITISPTPPTSPSTPGRTPSPCDEDELFRTIRIEVDPVKPKPVNKPKPPLSPKTEYYPDIQKRSVKEKPSMLKYKYNLMLITRISKRKAAFPKKEPTTEGDTETPTASEMKEEPKEDTGGEDKGETQDDNAWVFNDEDLTDEDYLEIFYSESPVWWEDPPNDDYNEEPIDRALIEETMKVDSPLPLEEDMEMRTNEIHRSNQTFFKKKSKLESVLDNIKIKKTAAEKEDKEKRESRCSESSDEDIFSVISLHDMDMIKSLENIVIPVENTLTDNIQHSGEYVDGSNDKVAEGMMSKNIGVEDIEIGVTGKYAGQDTGKDAATTCIENINVGDISAAAAKADEYMEKEKDGITTSNKEKRDDKTDRGDLEMYVEMNKEDKLTFIKLTFSKSTVTGGIQRNNEKNIFTDLVAADIDGEVRDLEIVVDLISICEQNKSEETGINKTITVKIDGSHLEKNEIESNKCNTKNAQKTDSESISTHLNKPKEINSKVLNAVETSAKRKERKKQSVEIVIKECNTKWALETGSDGKCSQHCKQGETCANEIKGMQIGAARSELEKMQSDEMIVKEYHKNASGTDSEKGKIAKETPDVVENDTEMLDLQKLHAGKIITEECTDEHRYEKEVNSMGAEEIALEKNNDRLNVEKLNKKYPNEIETISIGNLQSMPEQITRNEIGMVKIIADLDDLEKIHQNNQEEICEHNVDVENINPENIGLDRFNTGRININNDLQSDPERIKTQRKINEQAAAQIINILKTYSRNIIKGYNNQQTYEKDLRKYDHLDNNGNIRAVETVVGKRHPKKYEISRRGKIRKLKNTNLKLRKKWRRVSETDPNHLDSKQYSHDIGPKNMDRVEESVADIGVVFSESDKICETMESENTNERNGNVEQNAVKLDEEGNLSSTRGDVLKNDAKMNLGLCNDRLNVIETVKQSIHSQPYSPDVDAKKTGREVIGAGETRAKNSDSVNICEIPESEKVKLKLCKKRDILEMALKSIFCDQLDPDKCANNTNKDVNGNQETKCETLKACKELTATNIIDVKNINEIEKDAVDMREFSIFQRMCDDFTLSEKIDSEFRNYRVNVLEINQNNICSQQNGPDINAIEKSKYASNSQSEKICKNSTPPMQMGVVNINTAEPGAELSMIFRGMCTDLIHSEKINSELCNKKNKEKSIFSQQCGPDTIERGPHEKHASDSQSEKICENSRPLKKLCVENINTVVPGAVKMYEVGYKFRKLCEELINSEKIDSELCNEKISGIEIISKNTGFQGSTSGTVRINNRCTEKSGAVKTHTGTYESEKMNLKINNHNKKCAPKTSRRYISEIYNEEVKDTDSKDGEFVVVATYSGNSELDRMCKEEAVNVSEGNNLEKINTTDGTHDIIKDPEKCIPKNIIRKIDAEKPLLNVTVEVDENYNYPEIIDLENTQHVGETFAAKINIQYITETKQNDTIGDENKNYLNKITETMDPVVMNSVKTGPVNRYPQTLEKNENSLGFFAQVNTELINANKYCIKNEINPKTTYPVGTESQKCINKSNAEPLLAETRESVIVYNTIKHLQNELSEPMEPVKTNTQNSTEIHFTDNRYSVIVSTNNDSEQNEITDRISQEKAGNEVIEEHCPCEIRDSVITAIISDKNMQNAERTDAIGLFSDNTNGLTEAANTNYVQNELTDTVDPITVNHIDTKIMLIMNNNEALIDENKKMHNEFTEIMDLVETGPLKNIQENAMVTYTVRRNENTKEEAVGSNKCNVLTDDLEKMDPGKTDLINDAQRTYLVGNKSERKTVEMETEILYQDTLFPTEFTEEMPVLTMDSLKLDPSKIHTQQIYSIGRNAEIRLTENMEPEIVYPDNSPPTEFPETDILIVTPVRIDPIRTYPTKKCTVKNKKEMARKSYVAKKRKDVTKTNPVEISTSKAKDTNITEKRNKVIKAEFNSNQILLGKLNNEFTMEAVPIDPRSNMRINNLNKHTKLNSYVDYLNLVIESDHNYWKKVQILETLVLNPIVTNKVDHTPENIETNPIDFKRKKTANLNILKTSQLIEEGNLNDPIKISSMKEHLKEEPNLNVSETTPSGKDPKDVADLNDPKTLTSVEEELIVPVDLYVPKISPSLENPKDAVNLKLAEISPLVKETSKDIVNLNVPDMSPLVKQPTTDVYVPETLQSVKEPSQEVVNLNDPKMLPSNDEVHLNIPETLSLAQEPIEVAHLNIPEVLPSETVANVNVPEVLPLAKEPLEIAGNLIDVPTLVKEPLQEDVIFNMATAVPELPLPLQSTEEVQSTNSDYPPFTINSEIMFETIILYDSDDEIKSEPVSTNTESTEPSTSEIDDPNELVVVYRIIPSDEEFEEAKRPEEFEETKTPEPMKIDEDIPKIESKMDQMKTAKLIQIYGRRNSFEKYTQKYITKAQKRKRDAYKISIDKDRLGKKLFRKIRRIKKVMKKKKKRSGINKCTCSTGKCIYCWVKRSAQRKTIRPCLRVPDLFVKNMNADEKKYESDSQCSSINHIYDLSNNRNL